MPLDPESLHLYIRIDDSELDAGDYNRLCSIVRALFYCNGNSNGQSLSNKAFKAGRVVTFGAAPMKTKFATSVRQFIRKDVREFISMRDG